MKKSLREKARDAKINPIPTAPGGGFNRKSRRKILRKLVRVRTKGGGVR